MPLHVRGKMWEAGCDYLDSARAILSEPPILFLKSRFQASSLAQVFHESRPSTVQSLLLLGYREFGIGTLKFIQTIYLHSDDDQSFEGSQEQAWLFTGT